MLTMTKISGVTVKIDRFFLFRFLNRHRLSSREREAVNADERPFEKSTAESFILLLDPLHQQGYFRNPKLTFNGDETPFPLGWDTGRVVVPKGIKRAKSRVKGILITQN